MSLFKRLCSAFTSSVENAISELSEHTSSTNNNNTNNANITNSVEATPPTAKNSTFKPNDNSNDIISKYVFNDEIQSGTQIVVNSGEAIVVIKNGAIVNLLTTGVYAFNDSNISDFTTGSAYIISLKESDKIKWGTVKPIAFTDNQYGLLSLRLRGTYSYKICDIVKFVNDYMNCSLPVNDYTRNLLINAVEIAISRCNGGSYTQLKPADISRLIENELVNTGLSFNVKLDMITPTEESNAVIKQAMQNAIFNNQ